MAKDMCARKFKHQFETVDETKDHLIKRCIHCQGLKFEARRNSRITKSVPIRVPSVVV